MALSQTLARPLYLQVRDILIARIADGVWKAGVSLPSEFALADELGVSQGTVRKALDAMAANNLIERRQGKGTFVPEITRERSLFHFFKLQTENGSAATPELVEQALSQITANESIAALFEIATDENLWKLERLRRVDDRPTLFEDIYLPTALFPIIHEESPFPNALYGYYQSAAGLSVASADDRLKAIAADERVAEKLKIATGAPILLATRKAKDLRGQVIEVRQSYFLTDDLSYAVTLR